MQCRDVMSVPVGTCRLDTQVADCGRMMSALDIGCVPVLDYQDRLAGMVTARDLAERVVGEGRSPDTQVSVVMSTALVTCSPEDSLRTAEDQMRANHTSRVLVVDRQRHLLGVLSVRDIAPVEPPERSAALFMAVKAPRHTR